MHCSVESAFQVGEFINNFQFSSIHNNGLAHCTTLDVLVGVQLVNFVLNNTVDSF